MRVQRILDRVWRWLGADRRLIEILIVLIVVQCAVLIVPQAPVPTADSPAYLRWRAQLRPDFKGLVVPLSSLGLLSLRTSLWTRVAFTLLTLLIAVRVDVLLTDRTTLSHPRRLRLLLFCLAGVLIIAGWGVQTVWGWKQPQVIAWPDADIVVPERGITLPPQPRRWHLWTGQYGLYLLPKGESVGVKVQATDLQGVVLPLLPSARSDPQNQLQLALTAESPEAYFALSPVGLVFRISRLQGETAIQAQVYRSASGELLAETTLQGNGALFAGDIRLKLEYHVLPRYEAVYNPGALVEGAGMVLLTAVVIGWRTRRAALDELVICEDAISEGTGG